MPADLTDLLHDITILQRFVEFIDDYCKGQERSQSYADASGAFFHYVRLLATGIKEQLPQQVQLADRFPKRLPPLRSGILTLKRFVRLLHALVKPAADAHVLTIPAPLIDLASDQLIAVKGMRGSKIVVLLASELMYSQLPHSAIKVQARLIESFIPTAKFPQKLGFIELPYSQGPSFFSNLAIYHEIGHFVYQELSASNDSAFLDLQLIISRSVRVAIRREKDPQLFSLARRMVENWTQEIFCDLFAIRLVGPAFSLSLIEMLGMLGFLSKSSSIRFDSTHPAPAFRFAEHLQMLREDSWWDALHPDKADQIRILKQFARMPASSYRYSFDERKQGLRSSLVSVFTEVITPSIRNLVRDITEKVACSAARFERDRDLITKCLLAGVVPHGTERSELDPVAIINASFLVYLTSIPRLIESFEKAEDRTKVDVYSKWTKRVEMWTMKAIDDARLCKRFRKVRATRRDLNAN